MHTTASTMDNRSSEQSRPLLLAFMLTLLLGFCLGGCNTIEGAGEDISDAGEEIEDAAD